MGQCCSASVCRTANRGCHRPDKCCKGARDGYTGDSAQGRCRSAGREFPTFRMVSKQRTFFQPRLRTLGKYLKGGRMTTRSNFAHLNLEYYRKQAKKLLKAAHVGDAEALARLAAVAQTHVCDTGAAEYKLHDA